MIDSIVKGEFILGFIYDSETNTLAPSVELNAESDGCLPFEVVFRLAASFTQHVLDQHRKMNYGENSTGSDWKKIADDLRELVKNQENESINE